MSEMALFDAPPPRRKRQRDRTNAAHICPCCGGRTYRRIRRMPTLGVVDARCQRCAVVLNVWPEQHTDRTTRKETP